MADRVQFILDRMAPLFKEMERLEIFSKDEVKSIVKQRTDYEYLLRRRQLVPADYYKYLKFEINLEELRAIRCHSLSRQATKEVQQQYRKLQSSFMKHISYVFERGLRRFPDNMEMWADYISFLKEKKAYNTLNTVFGSVLSLHPTNEDLWLQASMFELGTNSNAHASRVLLQRALRFNSKSEKLWLRYFELELWYSLRNIERRNVLGLDTEVDESSDPTLGVPWVVYKHAATAITENETEGQQQTNQKFLLKLCTSCESLSPALHKRIYSDIQERYGNTAGYWLNLLQRYVQETIFQSPIEEDILGKRSRDDELEAANSIRTNVDSLACYLEDLLTLLGEYQNNVRKSIEETKLKYEIFGRIISIALQRVMGHLSKYTSELIDQSSSHTTTTDTQSKKKKKGKVIETQSNSKPNSAIRLSQILDKYRELLVGLDAPTDLKSQSDLLITKHQLFQSISFLSDISSHSFDTTSLPRISTLDQWLSENILRRLSSTAPNYRELAGIASNVMILLWKSSQSSLASLDLINYRDSADPILQQKLPETLSEVILVTKLISKHFDLILIAEDTETLSSPSASAVEKGKLISEFVFFLSNPSPLLSSFIRSERVTHRDGESDSESESDSDEESFHFPTQIEIMRSIISSRNCSQSSRIQWTIRYLRYSAGQDLVTCHETIDWIEECFNHMPHALSGLDLTDYYSQAVEIEMAHIHSLPKQSKGDIVSYREGLCRVQNLLQNAIKRCETVSYFPDQLAEIQRLQGNHKAANHSLWKKKQAI